jgi:Ca2+:H+ antiporter
MAGLDSIKRQARKEAWYSDSWNPWRKNMRRNTFPLQSADADVEAAYTGRRSDPDEEDETPLSHFPTEPGPAPQSRGYSDGETIRKSSKEEYEMTSATGNGDGSGSGKPRDLGSEETAIEKIPTRPRSEEEKARRRFLGKFRKDKTDESPEDDDKPKPKPWYKGKDLKHEPFTVQNQLNATLFNSWVNILLLAAPAGIACNYAGVDGKIVFVVNFIAIIPLAGMLGFATEEIALHVGESLGGLLNASFG